jgi:hypothetical protein
MKSVARNEFGVLSSKNTASIYWGVTKTKKKDSFTVRFMEKSNQEVITFKPKTELSETLCARIAARFFDEPSLYSTSPGVISMEFPEGMAEVNTCSNTIDVIFKGQNEQIASTEEVDMKEYYEELFVEPTKVEKVKKVKVVDHFRNRVNEIMIGALSAAKAKLATQNAVYL